MKNVLVGRSPLSLAEDIRFSINYGLLFVIPPTASVSTTYPHTHNTAVE